MTFGLDHLFAATGTDPWRDHRGWDSETGAARKMIELGFQSVADVFAAVLEEVHPARAGRGDIVIVADAETGRQAVGVVVGAQIAAMAKRGLVFLPRSRAMRGFKVG